jgi:hypothetical protein
MGFGIFGAIKGALRQRAAFGTRSEREGGCTVYRDSFFRDPTVVEDDYRRLRAPGEW